MLEMSDSFGRFKELIWNEKYEWPLHLGHIGGVGVWVDTCVQGNETLFVEEVGGPAHAQIEILNHVLPKNTLDSLAEV